MLAQRVRELAHVLGRGARRSQTDPNVLAPGRARMSTQVRHTQLGKMRRKPVGVGTSNLDAVATRVQVERE
ncbi:hypothetical protein GS488_05780 [Rhodococcus hoagii]|nr:hypothetical protein [Prescottella equi]